MALQAMDSSSSSSSSSSQQANMLAAGVGAIATALVESPVELFRHQAQAGVGGGNFVHEMANTVRKQVTTRARPLRVCVCVCVCAGACGTRLRCAPPPLGAPASSTDCLLAARDRLELCTRTTPAGHRWALLWLHSVSDGVVPV
jgi:hypothetical protein